MDGVHVASSHVWTGVILEKLHWCLLPFSLVPDGCLYWAFVRPDVSKELGGSLFSLVELFLSQ